MKFRPLITIFSMSASSLVVGSHLPEAVDSRSSEAVGNFLKQDKHDVEALQTVASLLPKDFQNGFGAAGPTALPP
jgi:hypothetical protein